MSPFVHLDVLERKPTEIPGRSLPLARMRANALTEMVLEFSGVWLLI
jgi:hypothetical protein